MPIGTSGPARVALGPSPAFATIWPQRAVGHEAAGHGAAAHGASKRAAAARGTLHIARGHVAGLIGMALAAWQIWSGYGLALIPLAFTTGTGPELLIVDPILSGALLVLAGWVTGLS